MPPFDSAFLIAALAEYIMRHIPHSKTFFRNISTCKPVDKLPICLYDGGEKWICIQRKYRKMKKIILHSTAVIFALLSFHCSATQPVRVLQENETRIAASLGGPVIPLGDITIVLPYSTVGVEHGITSDVTMYGNIHPTTLLFKDLGLDFGAAVRLLRQDHAIPEVTVKGSCYFFWDIARGNNKRIFPTATLNASYSVGERKLLYFGADNLYQVHQPEYFVSPFIGFQFPLGETIALQVETKWMAMNKNTSHGIFEGAGSVDGKGNIGLLFGLEAGL
jgi:hypothetical protein